MQIYVCGKFYHATNFAMMPRSNKEFNKKMLVKFFSSFVFILLLMSAANTCAASSEYEVNLSNSIEHQLIEFVHNTVNHLTYSAYKKGGVHADFASGIYILDCSTYIDMILKSVYPKAYYNLVHSTWSEKPSSRVYYDFFMHLSKAPKHYWDKIDNVKYLRAGDILVFRYLNRKKKATGGHVMIVMDSTQPSANTVLVRVADSAAAGHSKDTREPHASGIGVGTLLLKVNPKTGHPSAYAWKLDAPLKSNVTFAMARPRSDLA